MRRLAVVIGAVCYVLVTTAQPAAPSLEISEFMASNNRVLADEDGDFPDWIEVHNLTTNAVSLGGYYLTDDPAHLRKWAFPEMVLPADGYLLVFASGKNRRNPAARLHANFELAAEGEFLALTDGQAVVHGFVPTYPPQSEDISYGIARRVMVASLLDRSVPQILIPASAGQWDNRWAMPDFVPSGLWFTGAVPAAVGYDTNKGSGVAANVALSGTASQSTTLSSYSASLAINGSTSDFTHTTSADSAPFWQVTLTNHFAISRVILYNRSSCCQSRLRDIRVLILSTNVSGIVTNWQSPLLNPENAGYTYPNGPMSITVDVVALNGEPVLGRMVRVIRIPDPDLSGSGGQGNADEPNVLSLAEVVVEGMLGTDFGLYLKTDVQPQMLGVNASAFLRLPFVVSPQQAVERLRLRLRYDDGFVAYLNGVEVARANAPAVLDWNSAAVTNRTLPAARLEETFDLSAQAGLLVPGTNWLAIHAMNVSAQNGDFLMVPVLELQHTVVSSYAWLVDATPGTQNNSDFYYGQVADTKFSVNRGFFFEPFTLSITSATPGAEIYYSFNGDEPAPGKGMLYTGPLTITNTTVVRARAFKAGYRPTNVDTHTYLFLDDVIYQSPDGRPPPYFPASWGRNRVDYGMDPEVVSKYTREQWREALTQIPTLSIVTELPNLFDPVIGIYANADGHGEEWERPSSIELLDPTNAVPGRFQAPCGLRIRGGYSRNANFVKHSFRVFFRRDYGLGRLRYPLFEDEGAQEFDTFDLRTSQNYSWPRETGSNGLYETMVREVWCRETLGAMGQPYRRSRYYHLYLNGQYWGLYETDERPEASYGEIYLGGRKEDYDVVKCANHVGNFVTEVTDGNMTSWSNLWVMVRSVPGNPSNSNYFRILGRNPDGTRNPSLPVMLDVDNLIDYMIGIFYSGDGDATLSAFLSNTRPNNWFAMKNRNNPERGWIFFNSDCEHTLGAPSWQVDRTGPWSGISGSNVGNFTYSNPQYMHEDLMNNPEYRLRFADHVQKHFFNNGALTFSACTNRWWRKASQITKAIRAYSARWGDAAPREPPYGETDWINAVNAVPNTIFPTRADVVLAQLKTDGLYPAVNAPGFNRHGGYVTNGFPLAISLNNPSGVVYYTLDGSDPRLVGGAVSPTAAAYTAPIPLTGSVRVKARALVNNVWSALLEADFLTPELPSLRVTELMYHPAPPTAAEQAAGFTDADLFEYLELRNVGTQTVALAGVRFIEGISFQFEAGTLAPGARLVLVRNRAAFTLRYGAQTPVAGVYVGQLSNAGETLHLVDAAGRTIQRFGYGDGWYPITDGYGFSLVVVDENAPASLWDNRANWRPSGAFNGSPGGPNLAPPLFPAVVVNEVLAHSGPGQVRAVELANLGDTPADISGWWLTDDLNQPFKFQFPSNSIIPPGGFRVVMESELISGMGGLTWSGSGGAVGLFSANPQGQLSGYYHGFNFRGSEVGVSWGRHVTSTGAEHFVRQARVTLGEANAGPAVGPVVIAEIMYRPPDLGTNDNSREEYIVLANITSQPVLLFDPASPTNTWRISGGVDFVFPTNVWLPPRGRLMLVNFNPVNNPGELAAFRQKYGVPPEMPILGAYAGKLDNSGEDVELKAPIEFATGFRGEMMVEQVSYRDNAPWPGGADGFGASLQRIDLSAYANDPANWRAAWPRWAGGPLMGAAPVFTLQPQSQTVVEGSTAVFTATATGEGPITYYWRYKGTVIATNTSGLLTLTNVSLAQQGNYSVGAANAHGVTLSEAAALAVLSLPSIVQPPLSTNVLVGGNVTLTVVASSPWPLGYQWQKDGVDIPGANGASLTLTNVQIAHEGAYRVIVSDLVGARVSAPAWVQPMRRVTTVQGIPSTLTVTAGVDVVFAPVFSGYPPPFYYQFQRVPVVLENRVTEVTNPVFRIVNIQITNAGVYRITATNLAGTGASVLCNVTVISWPLITNQPLSRSAPAGTNVTLTAGVAGTAPLSFQWYRAGGEPLLWARTNSLTLTNLQAGVNDGGYYLVITNAYGAATSDVAVVSVAGLDLDGDGLPDDWEARYGLGSGPGHGRDDDPDGDGRTNYEEYLSGTHPLDARSVLKVEGFAVNASQGALLRFTAQPDIAYVVEYLSPLGAGPWTVWTNLPAQPTTNAILLIDPAARNSPQIYYRIRAWRPNP
ncbi:MAG: lamin tail domain-containing protein [Verrucomicrobiae bacterium]|nr:lamin tail domain-containing protein [Verrucomicrobiae bacterium]